MPADTTRRVRCLALLLTLALAACTDGESALARGDRFWADSNYTAALAEYRLSLAQRPNDQEVRARVAHAYAINGQFERAREQYERLIAASKEWVDQAVFDYVTLAEHARERTDRYGMASAIEAALALRPGLPVENMAAALARYHATTGDPARALDFYERALTTAPPDSVPALLYEIGEVHVAQGDCAEAIGYFNAFRNRIREEEGEERTDQDDREDQARWHVGNCSFTLARHARQSGDQELALRHLETMIQLGVPQNLLDQAWYERGEALLALGRRQEALQAFTMVVELSPTRSGQLVDRAQQRIDELRFGRFDFFR